MPTDAHEGLLALFRENPELLPAALEVLLEISWGAAVVTVTPSSEGLTQRSLELRPDGVWLIEWSNGERWVVVVEIQRRIDERKRADWPLYEWAARRKFGCPAVVLVVTPHERVARWAAEPILTPTGGSFRALVLSPQSESPVLDLEQARRAPARAVLSAMLQGQAAPELAVQAASVAAEAVRTLPEAQATLYLDLIESSLSPAALERWEEQMSQPGYVWKSAFAKKHRGEGREEGRAAAIRELVGRQLAARFGTLPDWASERLREAGLEDIERWSLRLVSVARLEDVFSTSE